MKLTYQKLPDVWKCWYKTEHTTRVRVNKSKTLATLSAIFNL